MQLKKYQQEVLNDLADFMTQLDQYGRLDTAYHQYWLNRGIEINSLQNDYLHPYDNSVKGVPRVMFKVPTAGGKTFIACNSLRVIFEHMPSEMPKAVAWFVPSDAILQQTLRNLKNPQHPYRQIINSHFNSAVHVVDKEAALGGQGIRPNQMQEQLTIFVLSVQSFAANNKDGRRVYRENSALSECPQAFGNNDTVAGADETSLINYLAKLNPVVIIDESHNFEANLRLDMLNLINPRFILDLTATPRQKSNIISFVDAIKLKKENMVKLPVIVYNRNRTADVIVDAINLQRNLERRAIQMRQNGGSYIRPIVLFQAQPKTDKDNVTFDKIKKDLVELGIPEDQIKIKTAEKDEIKNLDLMSDECPVRYIITINALKEGWDCPFAYILASLANKSSKVDVEQILGRILRQPYTTRHADEFLNLSYVFTSSDNFRGTLEGIIRSLNNAGFSAKDYRVAEDAATPAPPQPGDGGDLFGNPLPPVVMPGTDDPQGPQITEGIEDKEEIKKRIQPLPPAEPEPNPAAPSPAPVEEDPTVSDILNTAQQQNSEYETQMEEQGQTSDPIPTEIEKDVKSYSIKEEFRSAAAQIKLPTFHKKVNTASFFAPEGEFVPLTRASLSEDFELEKSDLNIDFTRPTQEAVQIDLEERTSGEFVPKHKNLNDKQIHAIREMFVEGSTDFKRGQLAAKIAQKLNFDGIYEPHITWYVKAVLDSRSDEELTELFDNEVCTLQAFKDKINALLTEYQVQAFRRGLDTGKIKCLPSYSFDERIIVNRPAIGLSKGLYVEEDGDINDFEYRVINQVANSEKVMFWHRNPERGKGFCLNGFINHYPDFIVHLYNGHTILIETKGDDRDNSDSQRKVMLGKTWENKSGDKYHYFMVFDKNEFQEGITIKKLLQYIEEME